MRTEDGIIIRRCLNGETEAFGFLVDKYKASVYAFAYAKLRDFHDAEDATQEVFLKAFQKLRSLKRYDRFLTWLYVITSNLCCDWCRVRQRRVEQIGSDGLTDESAESSSLETYWRSLPHQRIREALEGLPEQHRSVLTLYYLGGLDSVEIARFLGIRPTAVRQRLSRARAYLREEVISDLTHTFEGQRLQPGFTVRLMERIRPRPNPLAHLPWGLPIAAGVLMSLLLFGSYLPHGSRLEHSTDHLETETSTWIELPIFMASADTGVAEPSADASVPSEDMAEVEIIEEASDQPMAKSGTLENHAAQFTNRQALAHSRLPGPECLAMSLFRVHIKIDLGSDMASAPGLPFDGAAPWSAASQAGADTSGTELAEWLHRHYPRAGVTVLLDERVNLYPGTRCWEFNGLGEVPVVGRILKTVLGDSPALPAVLQFMEEGALQYRGLAVNRRGAREVQSGMTHSDTLDRAFDTRYSTWGVLNLWNPFFVDGHFAQRLDQGKIPDELAREFSNDGMPLGPKAMLSVIDPGERWQITRGKDQIEIRLEGNRLHVIPPWHGTGSTNARWGGGATDRIGYLEVTRLLRPNPDYITLRPGEVLDLSAPPHMSIRLAR